MADPPQIIDNSQRRSLLYMAIVVVVVTLLCFTASALQIYYIHTKLEKEHKPNLDSIFSSIDNLTNATNTEKFEHARWKTLATLEANDLENEYHQANIFLLSRLWISYLGAITGMILALAGGTFMIGKLKDIPVNVDKASEDKLSDILKASLMSVLPGLIIALVGSALILISLFINYPVNFKDHSKFTKEWSIAPSKEISAPPKEASTPIKEAGSK